MDCVIIGGGPAGLTAALYLGRFRRSVTVVDAGNGRASWIPTSHNQPSHPNGIGGTDLLARMREQALAYGARMVEGHVVRLERLGQGGFVVTLGDGCRFEAKHALLATGGEDSRPPLDEPAHRDAVRRGLVRYCPICDAYEAIDRKLALLSSRRCRVREALLLRSYTADLTLVTKEDWDLDADDRALLLASGIAIVDSPIAGIAIEEEGLRLRVADAWLSFDALYVALGLRSKGDLALGLGAVADEDGALEVNAHQETAVAGLYAAGDTVQGLAQVSVAIGQAAIAATAIHNTLPIRRA